MENSNWYVVGDYRYNYHRRIKEAFTSLTLKPFLYNFLLRDLAYFIEDGEARVCNEGSVLLIEKKEITINQLEELVKQKLEKNNMGNYGLKVYDKPKLMLVSESDQSSKVKRVVFAEKTNSSGVKKYIAWCDVKTIKESIDILNTAVWDNAEEIKEELVHLTLKDISEGKGVGVPSHLIRIKE
jgi:hypothetical protein